MKTMLLAIMLASTLGTASGQTSTVYKCNVNGKTIYSESPCGYNTTKRMEIDTGERMGNETFDRQTIDAARARIRAGMDQPGGKGASMGGTASNSYQCNSIKKEMDDIDSNSRQRGYHWNKDWLNQRKYDLQKQANNLGC